MAETNIETAVNKIKQNVANTYAVLYGMGADAPVEETSDNLAATAGTTKVIRYDKQTLTAEQKLQARTNIDAASTEEVSRLSGAIAELEEIISNAGSGGDVEYEEQVTSDNKFDNAFDETGKLDFDSGEDADASSLSRSSQFYDFGKTVTGNVIYATSKTYASAYKFAILLYDENKTYTGKYIYVQISSSTSATEKAYGSGVAENARYFRVYKTLAYDGEIYISTVNPGSADAANFEYKKEMVAVGGGGITVNANKKLAGKVVVNFGDSIFGKRRPPDDISTELAKITGATVHNCGFGGCHMSNHFMVTYSAFSMCNLADSIASGDWTTQDAAIADTSSNAVPSYFSDGLAILKGLDFNDVDIITIAYGTNDFTSADKLDDTDNRLDTNTFAGALRYSIETLLTAYPHLKIFVCSQTYRFWMADGAFVDDSDTHTNDNGVKLTDFVVKTKEVAEQYHLPYIDNYNVGFNKFNRGYYFSATDGTHPLTVGCHLIARRMANDMY